VVNLYDELVALVRVLDEGHIPYALCGALALAVYGVPRATKDIDLLARPEDEEKIRAALRRSGFVLEALPMTFASGIRVRRFSKIVEGRPLMVDVLWVDPPLQAIWEARQTLAWREGQIQVVGRDGLVTLKLTAGRPQDLADIEALMRRENGDG
jgi:hypothetical protein